MAEIKIFYSWQSDHPNNTNRGFIETALEGVAKTLRKDESIKVEPVVERDTKGVPGSPDIVTTIFSKIEQSDIFVCDVSIINDGKTGRPTPNPNVLVELGYAIKMLGFNKVIMVMNTAFGGTELLPFDLRTKRVTTYCSLPNQAERSLIRNELQKRLEDGLREIIKDIELLLEREKNQAISNKETPLQEAINAVKNNQPNQGKVCSDFFDWFLYEINAIAPQKTKDEEWDESLVKAIDASQKLVLDFIQVARTIAEYNAEKGASAIYGRFAKILECYEVKEGFSGTSFTTDFDFYKFIGHEAFVSFMYYLIDTENFRIISELMDQQLFVKAFSNRRGNGLVDFTELAMRLQLLDHRNRRLRLNRCSVHADILQARHTEGILSKELNFDDFIETDFFLYLRKTNEPENYWIPWSSIYLGSKTPVFLAKSIQKKYAEKLLVPLGYGDIEEFKEEVVRKRYLLREIFRHCTFFPLEYFQVSAIGSK